ncbi:MAG: single-stranded-DNA-specific exonuclease RecJ [Candidatus Pacebacteria bacterium]|jgi:single-stranded-DNA-specific exonuclease|nr:single-stranded-DNA-specific exonuclease RecJ [Candidatus Paceibacterota bacterium]MBT4651978.1 single-stranded-DNA-specific exonuclease RecJ [Candidatus Paceibacterota bacterium]MBT6756000.1 single-stranded-DNA-specific exonuclease RecJ [Candidatus Paceibacterota bacterium]MBT6920812.1 single-stranded-DNA-specific exonuclease RecJ [Candidatus Paceibacterota bacterium]
MKWHLLTEKVPSSLEDVYKILLKNRQVANKGDFFEPKNPIDLSAEELGVDIEMLQKAKDRILEAIKKKQKIIVFGDYDADGISATAILWQTLYDLGADALPFIPHREKHGYGLTTAALEEIYKTSTPDLLITVDTGIVAHEEVEKLKEKNIDVIITDHHQPDETLPEALAVVHSTKICGAAVAWVLAREFTEEAARKNLDLVALATVTDLMPLKGVNRAFVHHGLEVMNKRERLGLLALQKVAGLENKNIESMQLGFVLGPRINAMGRLSHAVDALRLLCTKNKKRASELASLIDSTNSDRKQLTQDLYQLARGQVSEQKKEHILVVHSDEFHEGIIGLIAGKLTQSYAKPSIVISTRGETAKASARSVVGVNITEVIRSTRDLLLAFGGHPMAAGFGFEHDNLEPVIDYMFNYGRENIDKDLLQKRLSIECLLPLDFISLEFLDYLQKFSPFGQKNPEPIFALKNIKIKEIRTIGKQQNHLKLLLTDETDNLELTALAWGRGDLSDSLQVGQSINAAVTLQINEWMDRKNIQAIVKDFQVEDLD